MLGWIDAVDPRPEDRDGRCGSAQAPAVSRRIDATREPARDDQPAIRQFLAQPMRDVQRVGRRGPRPDDRDDGPGESRRGRREPRERAADRECSRATPESAGHPRQAARSPPSRAAASAAVARVRASVGRPRPFVLRHLARLQDRVEHVVEFEARLMADFLERGGGPRARCGQHRQGHGGERVHCASPFGGGATSLSSL